MPPLEAASDGSRLSDPSWRNIAAAQSIEHFIRARNRRIALFSSAIPCAIIISCSQWRSRLLSEKQWSSKRRLNRPKRSAPQKIEYAFSSASISFGGSWHRRRNGILASGSSIISCSASRFGGKHFGSSDREKQLYALIMLA